jgi:predicted cupin superfamily sugar epimerase
MVEWPEMIWSSGKELWLIESTHKVISHMEGETNTKNREVGLNVTEGEKNQGVVQHKGGHIMTATMLFSFFWGLIGGYVLPQTATQQVHEDHYVCTSACSINAATARFPLPAVW